MMGRYPNATLPAQSQLPVSPFPLRATFTWDSTGNGDHKGYAILQGGWYQRSDWKESTRDSGYPAPMRNWSGLPAGWEDFDALIRIGDEPARCVTLFRGHETCCYHMDKDQLVGAVTNIRDAFSGLSPEFHRGIDAAAEGRKGKHQDYGAYYYLFRNGKYHRLVKGARRVDPDQSGAGDTLSEWRLKGKLSTPLDGVLNGACSRADALYFFKGHHYVRYDWSRNTTSEVRFIGEVFPELAPTLFDYFPRQPGEKLAESIVRMVTQANGLSPIYNPHMLGALVARGVDNPETMIRVGTNCATTALGFLVAAVGNVTQARRLYANLGAPYKLEKAIAWLFDKTNSLAATNVSVKLPEPGRLDSLGATPWPKPGDLLFYAEGDKTHVEWLLGDIDPKRYTALHGGGGSDFDAKKGHLENIQKGTKYYRAIEEDRRKRTKDDFATQRPFFCKISVSEGPIDRSFAGLLQSFISMEKLQARLDALPP